MRKTNDSKSVRWHLTEVNSKFWFHVPDSNGTGSGVCNSTPPQWDKLVSNCYKLHMSERFSFWISILTRRQLTSRGILVQAEGFGVYLKWLSKSLFKSIFVLNLNIKCLKVNNYKNLVLKAKYFQLKAHYSLLVHSTITYFGREFLTCIQCKIILAISYVYAVYFCQSQIWCSFLSPLFCWAPAPCVCVFACVPLILVKVAYMSLGRGLFAGVWTTYQWLHPWRKLFPLPW